MVSPKRIQNLNSVKFSEGVIAYWMSRDQRVHDNWALLYAQELSQKYKVPLMVLFCLRSQFSYSTERNVDFMIEGLKEVEKELSNFSIPFIFLVGDVVDNIFRFVNENKVGAIVSDFSPLKYNRSWKDELSQKLQIPLIEVDSHNIVPVWEASSKQEFAAYTIRPKIESKLYEYLVEFPEFKKQFFAVNYKETDWNKILRSIDVDKDVSKVEKYVPGSSNAKLILDDFIKNKIKNYNRDRNDPTKDGQSNFSAYLHYGQISSQRIALEISKKVEQSISKEFLEELIIRKELSDNFCYYNVNYDSPKGYPDWSKKTHQNHRGDKREYLYSSIDFESSKTHDMLWNSAQNQLIKKGKIHGYMRMYWAKKILEWSRDVNEAHSIAIHLNDKYSLDGRDPNGFTGVAWSIGGVHDRAWFEREIYGNIRYMNFNGAKRKFDVNKYISDNS